MVEKKKSVETTKKIYKTPAPVKFVESGKVLLGICPYSCGVQVSNMNANCGH